jgi:hypothetical protein
VLALAFVLALGPQEPSFQLPSNVTVTSRLLAIVTDAIRASPTLRDQFQRVGRNRRVRVHIDLDAAESTSGVLFSRAHTDLKRYEYGLVVAAMHLVSTEGAVQLIAHELEHVLEFAEGINYRAASLRTPRVAWRTGAGTFETARALHIERVVTAEVAGAVTVARREH